MRKVFAAALIGLFLVGCGEPQPIIIERVIVSAPLQYETPPQQQVPVQAPVAGLTLQQVRHDALQQMGEQIDKLNGALASVANSDDQRTVADVLGVAAYRYTEITSDLRLLKLDDVAEHTDAAAYSYQQAANTVAIGHWDEMNKHLDNASLSLEQAAAVVDRYRT